MLFFIRKIQLDSQNTGQKKNWEYSLDLLDVGFPAYAGSPARATPRLESSDTLTPAPLFEVF
jgi:hypothetical protein